MSHVLEEYSYVTTLMHEQCLRLFIPYKPTCRHCVMDNGSYFHMWLREFALFSSHLSRVSKLRIYHALYWMRHSIPYIVLSKCHLIIYTYGGLILCIHPRILPRICPRGIVLATPCVTSFIIARTSFKVSENILSGSFALLSGPHLLDSLKSSLICETAPNWHLIDWWNSSHPHVYFSR